MGSSIKSAGGAVLIAAVLAGCHHAQPSATAMAPEGRVANQDSMTRANARRDSIARADAERRRELARADSIRRANDARGAAAASARAALSGPVHFEFDQFEILTADRPLLERKAAILSANPAIRLRIEGNADERGSDEYNLALGMRRAATAKRYLIEHGIEASRMETTSNGEERPACQGHDEACWTQNRRADFVPTTRVDALVVPNT